jgi:hypothetical protein
MTNSVAHITYKQTFFKLVEEGISYEQYEKVHILPHTKYNASPL